MLGCGGGAWSSFVTGGATNVSFSPDSSGTPKVVISYTITDHDLGLSGTPSDKTVDRRRHLVLCLGERIF